MLERNFHETIDGRSRVFKNDFSARLEKSKIKNQKIILIKQSIELNEFIQR